jgi:hypothetical protein
LAQLFGAGSGTTLTSAIGLDTATDIAIRIHSGTKIDNENYLPGAIQAKIRRYLPKRLDLQSTLLTSFTESPHSSFVEICAGVESCVTDEEYTLYKPVLYHIGHRIWRLQEEFVTERGYDMEMALSRGFLVEAWVLRNTVDDDGFWDVYKIETTMESNLKEYKLDQFTFARIYDQHLPAGQRFSDLKGEDLLEYIQAAHTSQFGREELEGMVRHQPGNLSRLEAGKIEQVFSTERDYHLALMLELTFLDPDVELDLGDVDLAVAIRGSELEPGYYISTAVTVLNDGRFDHGANHIDWSRRFDTETFNERYAEGDFLYADVQVPVFKDIALADFRLPSVSAASVKKGFPDHHNKNAALFNKSGGCVAWSFGAHMGICHGSVTEALVTCRRNRYGMIMYRDPVADYDVFKGFNLDMRMRLSGLSIMSEALSRSANSIPSYLRDSLKFGVTMVADQTHLHKKRGGIKVRSPIRFIEGLTNGFAGDLDHAPMAMRHRSDAIPVVARNRYPGDVHASMLTREWFSGEPNLQLQQYADLLDIAEGASGVAYLYYPKGNENVINFIQRMESNRSRAIAAAETLIAIRRTKRNADSDLVGSLWSRYRYLESLGLSCMEPTAYSVAVLERDSRAKLQDIVAREFPMVICAMMENKWVRKEIELFDSHQERNTPRGAE